MRQREQRAKFAALVAQAQAQAEGLAKLDALDGCGRWFAAHQAIARGVSQIASRLEVSLREMTLNELSNPTARQLLADIGDRAPARAAHRAAGGSRRPVGSDGGRRGDRRRPSATRALTAQQEIVQVDADVFWSGCHNGKAFVDVVNQLRHIIQRQTVLKKRDRRGSKEANRQLVRRVKRPMTCCVNGFDALGERSDGSDRLQFGVSGTPGN